MQTVIADHPPNDGQEWDCQCARCGSSCDWVDCDWCNGEGCDSDDFDEVDDCNCDGCNGTGGWWSCLSGVEFCLANPLPGRENVERGNAEWFVIPSNP